MKFSYEYIEKKLGVMVADITDNYCLGRQCTDCVFNHPNHCGLSIFENSARKQIKELKEQQEELHIERRHHENGIIER